MHLSDVEDRDSMFQKTLASLNQKLSNLEKTPPPKGLKGSANSSFLVSLLKKKNPVTPNFSAFINGRPDSCMIYNYSHGPLRQISQL